MKRFTTLSGLLFVLVAGSMSYATDVVTVIDENNHPISNATILLGYEAGNPFPGNSLNTDASGTASVPADWKAALPVTVQARGFIASTIPVAMPGKMTIQLTHNESPNQIEIGGNTLGYGTLDDSSQVHFGLVAPAIDRQQMLAFDMSSVVSSQTDTIRVLGQSVDIPSNVALPSQTVTYIFPISLDKPNYRTYVRSPGNYTISALHGSFPLQKVVNDVRAHKPIFDMINYLDITEGTTAQLDVKGNTVGIDLDVSKTHFGNTVNVKAPSYASNQVMVSLALTEQNGLLTATDLKRVQSGQSMAMKSTGKAPSVLSLLLINTSSTITTLKDQAMEMFKPLNIVESYMEEFGYQPLANQSFNQLSFALLHAKNGVAPQFLSLIDPPALDASNVLKMNAPTIPAGLNPVATYMVLCEIQSLGTGKVTVEQRTRLWEVWSTAWLNQVELPKITFPRDPNKKYRWEVMYLAAPAGITGRSPVANGVDLKSVTHVTRNTLEI